MDNVTFDSETDLSRTIPAQKATAGITTWLLEKKIAKDESEATYILLGVLGVCVLITGFALMNLFGGGSTIDEKERMRIEQSMLPPQ